MFDLTNDVCRRVAMLAVTLGRVREERNTASIYCNDPLLTRLMLIDIPKKNLKITVNCLHLALFPHYSHKRQQKQARSKLDTIVQLMSMYIISAQSIYIQRVPYNVSFLRVTSSPSSRRRKSRSGLKIQIGKI